MKKADMLAEINSVLLVGKDHLTRIKAPKIFLDPPTEDWAKMPYAMISKAHAWFRRTMLDKYQKYLKVWALCKPEIWARMFAIGGFDDHAEAKLLTAAGVALRRALNKPDRPDFFKKGKVRDEVKRISQQSKCDGKTPA